MSEATITVWIPGEPQGKGRPRICRVGKFVRAVTPEKTRTYEGIIRTLAMEQMKGAAPLSGPVELEMEIMCPIPQSWPQWKRDMAIANRVLPTTKPDSDNVIKAIEDGCNGVVWADDCQIVHSNVSKSYRATPGVLLRVNVLEGLSAQTKRRPA